jgi:phage gpG-like protein
MKGKAVVKSNISAMKNINKIIKSLSDKHMVNIGILGSKKNKRKKELATNAEIGAVHEFGSISKKIPPRSFLRMPLSEKKKELLNFILSEKKSFEKQAVKGNLKKLFERIGIKAEQIIQKAFETAGFGKWKPPKYRDGMPLEDTSQLRRSITSKVVSRGK